MRKERNAARNSMIINDLEKGNLLNDRLEERSADSGENL